MVGGASYITSLISMVPTSVHVEHYGHIVERTNIMRRLIIAAGEIAALAYQEREEVDEVIDQAERILFDVSQRRISRSLEPISDVIRRYYDRVEFLVEHRDETLGVPTGFVDLDRLLGGLQPSDLIIIAARPGWANEPGPDHGLQCSTQEQLGGGYLYPGDVGRPARAAHDLLAYGD